ncbi:polysaccharide biosynthesis protein [Croceibacterium soli]|nr:nucleoside-diphosphate sugar epimerase/dehydratase [Croceibacterium soli]
MKQRLGTLVVRSLNELLQIERSQKRMLVIGLDAAICVTSVFIAFSLRVGALDFPLGPPLIFSAVSVLLFVPVFYGTGAYSTIFRFSGSRTILQLAKAIAIYSLPLMAVFLFWGAQGTPRTIAILQPMIFFGLAATSRILARYVLMDLVASQRAIININRVLIYGAGSSGRQLLLSLRVDPSVVPVAFVDDDDRLDQQRLEGVPVYHSARLAEVIAKQDIRTVLLALPRITRRRRSQIVSELRRFHVHVQTLPNIQELMDGKVSISDLREIQIEDLLGRDPVSPNSLLLGRTIVGKSVIVTGAGGSIGSELCRQILSNGVRRLVLFDVSEFALYQIDREIADRCKEYGYPQVEVIPALGSVTDRERLRFIFEKWQPATVYHAAAYKHVPLVEANPVEAIRNNIIGTEEVAQAAEAAGVSDFILISTDKAVRPTNVMGATKRAAEQVVQSFAARNSATRYSMVRFGNVLGSSGSVVPLFRRQIENGGPVTLTHRDVTRYFMTIPEAAQLVLQAGGLARGGEVFVLEMGDAVRIADLAKAMIELSGLTIRDEHNRDGDVEIVEVGLRPGEKLYEELLIGNTPQRTKHERILMAHEAFLPWPDLSEHLEALRQVRDRDEAVRLLQCLVPEFDHRRDERSAMSA